MTLAQLVDYFRKRAFGRGDGWKPAPLTLRLKPGQKPYAKPRRSHTCPSGLSASMEYMLNEQIRKGYMEEVPYFISQGFVQVKEGRCFPGTDLPMCRILVDCRALNAA